MFHHILDNDLDLLFMLGSCNLSSIALIIKPNTNRNISVHDIVVCFYSLYFGATINTGDEQSDPESTYHVVLEREEQ